MEKMEASIAKLSAYEPDIHCGIDPKNPALILQAPKVRQKIDPGSLGPYPCGVVGELGLGFMVQGWGLG